MFDGQDSREELSTIRLHRIGFSDQTPLCTAKVVLPVVLHERQRLLGTWLTETAATLISSAQTSRRQQHYKIQYPHERLLRNRTRLTGLLRQPFRVSTGSAGTNTFGGVRKARPEARALYLPTDRSRREVPNQTRLSLPLSKTGSSDFLRQPRPERPNRKVRLLTALGMVPPSRKLRSGDSAFRLRSSLCFR